MSNLLLTFALVKASWDRDGGYAGCLLPLILKILSDFELKDLIKIQIDLKSEFKIDIPTTALDLILKIGNGKELIKQEGDKYVISARGMEYKKCYRAYEDVERDINLFLKNFQQYLEKNQFKISKYSINNEISDFIKNNVDLILSFLLIEDEIKFDDNKKGFSYFFIKYIKELRDAKNPIYNIVYNLILGSIICEIFKTDPKFKDEIHLKLHFNKIKVFLDSNIVFSLGGLEDTNFNKRAKDLVELLYYFDFDVRIFDITLQEMRLLFRNFDEWNENKDSFLKKNPKIKMTKLFEKSEELGYTKSDLKILLDGLNFIIEPTNFDILQFSPTPERLNLYFRFTSQSPRFVVNHNIAAIDSIIQLRENPVFKIEESKALFTTLNKKLSRFNLGEHIENHTFCEVLSVDILSNILWLMEPKIDLPLNVIIALYSDNLLLNDKLWIEFYKYYKAYKNRPLNYHDLTNELYFYNSQIEFKGYNSQIADDIKQEKIAGKNTENESLIDKHEETKSFKEEYKRLFKYLKYLIIVLYILLGLYILLIQKEISILILILPYIIGFLALLNLFFGPFNPKL